MQITDGSRSEYSPYLSWQRFQQLQQFQQTVQKKDRSYPFRIQEKISEPGIKEEQFTDSYRNLGGLETLLFIQMQHQLQPAG